MPQHDSPMARDPQGLISFSWKKHEQHIGFIFYFFIFFQKKTLQEKQELLAKWVMSGENLQAVETQLKVSRKQSGELERGKELLTIDEMKSRGFSEYLDFI